MFGRERNKGHISQVRAFFLLINILIFIISMKSALKLGFMYRDHAKRIVPITTMIY